MYLHTSAHPVRADRICHQRVHARCADRARMAGIHQQPDLPSLYCSTFTNCAIKFIGGVAVDSVCREGGTLAFSAIRLKLAFSEISYCTFKMNYDSFCVSRTLKNIKNSKLDYLCILLIKIIYLNTLSHPVVPLEVCWSPLVGPSPWLRTTSVDMYLHI